MLEQKLIQVKLRAISINYPGEKKKKHKSISNKNILLKNTFEFRIDKKIETKQISIREKLWQIIAVSFAEDMHKT